MTLEELKALPVGSRIHEVNPDRKNGFSDYKKLEDGTWMVYASNHPQFDFYYILDMINPVTSEDFRDNGALDDTTVIADVPSAEETAEVSV